MENDGVDFYDGQERFSSREGGVSSDIDEGDDLEDDDDRSDVERFSDAFGELAAAVMRRMPDSWGKHAHDLFLCALKTEFLGDPGLRVHARGVILDPRIPRWKLDWPQNMPAANGLQYGPDEDGSLPKPV